MRDSNHKAIVSALYAVGCGVVDLAAVGGGVPDLLVGYRGRNILLEVKRPGVAGKKRGKVQAETNEKQQEFHAWWEGPIAIVTTVEEAIAAVSA